MIHHLRRGLSGMAILVVLLVFGGCSDLPAGAYPTSSASPAADLARFAGTYNPVGAIAYPIILKGDGTYSYSTKTGTYRNECVEDQEWLVFTGPLDVWAGGRAIYSDASFRFSWWEDNQPVTFNFRKR